LRLFKDEEESSQLLTRSFEAKEKSFHSRSSNRPVLEGDDSSSGGGGVGGVESSEAVELEVEILGQRKKEVDETGLDFLVGRRDVDSVVDDGDGLLRKSVDLHTSLERERNENKSAFWTRLDEKNDQTHLNEVHGLSRSDHRLRDSILSEEVSQLLELLIASPRLLDELLGARFDGRSVLG